MSRILTGILTLVLCIGCAAHPSTGSKASRGAAKAERRAAVVLLGSQADGARASAAVKRALRESPDSATSALLFGLERFVHGNPEAAAEAFTVATEVAHAAGGDRIAVAAVRRLRTLLDLAPHFRDRIEPRLARVFDHRGKLGVRSRAALADLLIELAYRRGDIDRVRSIAAAHGCIATWRVAGPFGPHALLGFDVAFAPDHAGPLRQTYDLGPGRGIAPTRTHEARGCATHLGRPGFQLGGTTYAQATVRVENSGRFSILIDTPNALELAVGGKTVARLDRRVRSFPHQTRHEVDLSRGDHEVTVKLTARHPNPVVSVRIQRSDPSLDEANTAVPEPLGDYLEVEEAIARGDIVSARSHLRKLRADVSHSAVMLSLSSEVQFADPLRDEAARRDQARATLRRITEIDARAWLPNLHLARLAEVEGRREEALHLLNEGVKRWPRVVAFPLGLADAFAARGWRAYQARAVQRAVTLATDRCAVTDAALSLARSLGRAKAASDAADAVVRCDARSTARYQHLLETRRWEKAAQELERLAVLEPTQQQAEIVTARATLARARGQEVRPLLEAMRALVPRAPDPVIALADLELAAGSRAQALEILRDAVAESPELMEPARRVHDALQSTHTLDEFRLDGEAIIRAYARSGRAYDHPQVLVLDYTVSRVQRDGSTLELTHNIFHIRSDEAVDSLGEFSAPPGADLLKLRTIKADGVVLEPQWIDGKESISLTNVAIGDYVEYEFVRLIPATSSLPGGVQGERFYFQTFDIPFDRSEYVVVVPSDMEVMVDPRGPAPKPVRKEHDGLRAFRWRVDNSEPLQPEPDSIDMREHIPSIAWGIGVSWQAAVDVFRDGIADRDVVDPDAVLLVRRLIQDTNDAEEKARRIYSWVMQEIEHTGETFGLAPAMVDQRSGHRSRVLHYLFQVAGLRSELVLARSALADQTRTEFAEAETYTDLMVTLELEQNRVYLHPEAQSAPFGFISPLFRGQDAITISPDAKRVRVRDTSGFADLHRVEAAVALRTGGGAHIEVIETLTGYDAVRWREDLREIPAAELHARFEERYLSTVIPRGELRSLKVEHAAAFERPLEIRYTVGVERFARWEGDRWFLPTIFRSFASANYARTSARSVPQVISNPTRAEVVVDIRLPPGQQLADRVVEHRRRFGQSLFERRVSLMSDGHLILKRKVVIPRMRVSPESYPSFAAFCHNVDRVESHEIALRAAPVLSKVSSSGRTPRFGSPVGSAVPLAAAGSP